MSGPKKSDAWSTSGPRPSQVPGPKFGFFNMSGSIHYTGIIGGPCSTRVTHENTSRSPKARGRYTASKDLLPLPKRCADAPCLDPRRSTPRRTLRSAADAGLGLLRSTLSPRGRCRLGARRTGRGRAAEAACSRTTARTARIGCRTVLSASTGALPTRGAGEETGRRRVRAWMRWGAGRWGCGSEDEARTAVPWRGCALEALRLGCWPLGLVLRKGAGWAAWRAAWVRCDDWPAGRGIASRRRAAGVGAKGLGDSGGTAPVTPAALSCTPRGGYLRSQVAGGGWRSTSRDRGRAARRLRHGKGSGGWVMPKRRSDRKGRVVCGA